MSVKSIGDYSFTPKDKVENFHGNMLVYMQWEKHLSFCAPLAFPLPPDMPFGDLVAGVLAPAYAVHPDSENVDFEKGEWCEIVDGLYWRFIDKNQSFFSKNPRLNMMVNILKKMPVDRKKRITFRGN